MEEEETLEQLRDQLAGPEAVEQLRVYLEAKPREYLVPMLLAALVDGTIAHSRLERLSERFEHTERMREREREHERELLERERAHERELREREREHERELLEREREPQRQLDEAKDRLIEVAKQRIAQLEAALERAKAAAARKRKRR